MNLKFYLIIVALLFAQISYACEFGRTEKDTYGKPDTYDLAVSDNGQAYYFPNGNVLNAKGIIWEKVFFDQNDVIEISTPYTHMISFHWPDKGEEPYIIYRGHRWYPQYHGIIYVYKDGHEVK